MVKNYLDLCEDGDRPTLDPATCAPSSVPAGRTAFWMAASAKASRRDRSSVGIGCCSSNVQRIFGPPLLCTVAKPTPAGSESGPDDGGVAFLITRRVFGATGVGSCLSFVIRTLFGNKGLALATRQVRLLTFAVRLKELTHGILDAISIRRRQGCSHEPSQREPILVELEKEAASAEVRLSLFPLHS